MTEPTPIQPVVTVKFAKVRTTALSTKNFLIKHRVAISVLATLAVTGSLYSSARSEWNDFLEKKGLTDEYYDMSDDRIENASPAIQQMMS